MYSGIQTPLKSPVLRNSNAALSTDGSAVRVVFPGRRNAVLAAGVNSTLMAGENLTVGSTVWLPAEDLAPGR